MKILFYFPDESLTRKSDLSYTSLKSGGGFSGTETALLELTKYLADNGHTITIFGVNKSYDDNGVKYLSHTDFDEIDFDIDWYSPIFFINNIFNKNILSKIDKKRTRVFFWFQCFIEDKLILNTSTTHNLYAQYLCKYVADEYKSIIPPYKSWIIYNGLSEIFLEKEPCRSDIKQGNWIFHPVFERGGKIAVDIYTQIHQTRPEAAITMTLMSYNTKDNEMFDSYIGINNVGSQTKIQVRDHLLRSDYFIYPLVLKNNNVHHDTFGSVMLEALACGVIVIVWDVACVSDIYQDYVVKIPIPEKIKKSYNPFARYGTCKWMQSDEAKNLFVDKIIELENNLELKECIRARGVAWARGITWNKLGAKMEENLEINRYT